MKWLRASWWMQVLFLLWLFSSEEVGTNFDSDVRSPVNMFHLIVCLVLASLNFSSRFMSAHKYQFSILQCSPEMKFELRECGVFWEYVGDPGDFSVLYVFYVDFSQFLSSTEVHPDCDVHSVQQILTLTTCLASRVIWLLSSLVQSACLLEYGVHGKWSGRYVLFEEVFLQEWTESLSGLGSDYVNDVQINSLQHRPDQADRESVQYEDPEIRAYHEWYGRASCYWW